jgi:tRNA A-37 threonylcarbamoyl transferase component Bud32/tetratricopeptide (TPR) repeat protein
MSDSDDLRSEPDLHQTVTLAQARAGRGASELGILAFGRDDAVDTRRKIGRYPILRRLGVGGMGVVYAAYDEILDRRLAIKVLHQHLWDVDGRRSERLLREAQAMARITHPNVITVHEVGTAGEQLFVAMEFVEGPTLEQWLASEKRTWQQIVGVFRQIAEGIAAIHDAGLVHRDIKPANVLIGSDGRVRVLDLGLVASGLDEPASSSSSSHRIEGSLTMTGERVGTPAYMSREQFLGLELTPASDIFSFCVALYEALHGVHPFMGSSFFELQANVVDGHVRPTPSTSNVPAWLHALVVRGLASEPADRPASMRVLSSELAKDPSRVRRRWIGTLVTAALAATLGVLVARAQTPVSAATCDGGEAAIADVWSPDRAADIRAAMIAADKPYAPALADRTTEALEDYADDWAGAHDQTCREHARGHHSDTLLDARMACLDRRRQAFAETVEILADADTDVVDHAGEMVAKLPRLASCDDLGGLVKRRGLLTDPALAPFVTDLESRLVRAEVLANAGRIEESTALARAVAVEAEALAQPRLVALALLGEARASILQFDRSALGVLLGRALEISIAQGLDALAAEAMIRRLYVRGLSSVGSSEAALADVPIAEAMLVRAGDDPELRALLRNNEGAIQAAAGDREAAREAFARGLAINERLFGDHHLELAVSLANLGMLTPDPATRSALHGRMITIYEQRLGPDHPRTLDGRLLAAFHTADPERAGAAFEQLCPRFRVTGQPRFTGECELERARIEVARGRLDVARGALEVARELLDGDPRGVLIDAYLVLGGDGSQAAIVALRERIAAVEDYEDSDAWWVQIDQAEHRLLLASLLLQNDSPSAAIPELEQAIAGLDAIADQAEPLQRERLLAGAQATLAFALVASEIDDPERIAALVGSARSFYRQWPLGYALRLDQLTAFDPPESSPP